MTQEGTPRDWATQIKLINKAFAQREAELKAELAQQSLGATEALDAAAAKITEIENLLNVCRGQLIELHQAANEREARLLDAAAQAARANAEQLSTSELATQELTQLLAEFKGHEQALESDLSATRAQYDLAVAKAAECEASLRAAHATSEKAATAAQDRTAQIEARCQGLADQIAAAVLRERSVRQALDEANKALAASEVRSQSRESAQLEALKALELEAEQSRAAHAAERQAAHLALRAAQDQYDRSLAQLQSALQEQKVQVARLATQREDALAQLGVLQDANTQLQARSIAREREMGAQMVQALEKAGVDLHKHVESTADVQVQHAERMGALQAEMLALSERGRLQVDALQAQLVSAHEAKASAVRGAAERERSLRDELQGVMQAAVVRAEANRMALQQETRIYLDQLADRDALHAKDRTHSDMRTLAAAEAFAALQARCDRAQTELAEARQQQLRVQMESELREQVLRSEHGQLHEAARHDLDAARSAWAVKQDEQLQQIQGLTEALAAAHEQEARLRATASQELDTLKAMRQSQITELAAQHLNLAESLALAARLQQELDELRNPAPQRRAWVLRRLRPALQELRDAGQARGAAAVALTAPLSPPSPISPISQPLASSSLRPTPPPVPHLPVRLAAEHANLPAPAAVDQPVSPLMTTYKTSDLPWKHISQLMALHGATFVTAAYRSVLGRDPDAHGAAYFLSRVETDHNKPAILYELATSAEGLARQQSLSGLDDLVASRSPARSRLRRWLNKFSRIEQTSMRIEWALAAFSQQSEDRLQVIDIKLGQITQGRQQLDARTDGRLQSLETRLTQVLASMQQLQENLGAGMANQGQQNAEGLNSLAKRLTDGQHTQDLIAERLRTCEGLLLASASRTSTGPENEVAAPSPATPVGTHAAPRALDCHLDASQGAQALIQSLASQLAKSAEAAALSAR